MRLNCAKAYKIPSNKIIVISDDVTSGVYVISIKINNIVIPITQSVVLTASLGVKYNSCLPYHI